MRHLCRHIHYSLVVSIVSVKIKEEYNEVVIWRYYYCRSK